VSTSFSDQVEREYKYFEESRTVEIKNALEVYTGVKTEFCNKVSLLVDYSIIYMHDSNSLTQALRDWKDVISTLEAIHVEED
jgi:hypothetical protein